MTILFISLYLYRYFRKLGHFKILNATMRKWYLDSQGKLVSYVLRIETRKSSEEMTFEELWIDEKRFKFRLSRDNRKLSSNFRQKDILNISPVPENNNEPALAEEIPNSKGKLVICYRIGAKLEFQTVSRFKEPLKGFRFSS